MLGKKDGKIKGESGPNIFKRYRSGSRSHCSYGLIIADDGGECQ